MTTTNTNTGNSEAESIDGAAVLGTHEYTGQVYSPEKAGDVMNIDLRTGECATQRGSADTEGQ
jgi:hypothetical protein